MISLECEIFYNVKYIEPENKMAVSRGRDGRRQGEVYQEHKVVDM
jgi:hypothetical protein